MSMIEIHTREGQTVGRLTVVDGPWAGKTFGMLYRTCENAACSCMDLSVALVDAENSETKASVNTTFTVDIAAKKRSEHDEEDRDRAITDGLISRFDEDDWKLLWDAFGNIKLEMTENLDYSQTHASFPMAADIETYGELVPYSMILPNGRKFHIGDQRECVLLDEQYCLKRGCDCDRVNVSFLPIENGRQKKGEVPGFDLQYRSGETENIRESKLLGKPVLEVWKEFLALEPNLLQIFRKRHDQLERLYVNYRKNNPVIEPIVRENRVGRNDPCPCGSGKKYKKCCLPLS